VRKERGCRPRRRPSRTRRGRSILPGRRRRPGWTFSRETAADALPPDPARDEVLRPVRRVRRPAHRGRRQVPGHAHPLGRAAELRKDEHACDLVVGRIIEALDRSFITPFDREDIHNLATALDDVMDNMEETAHRLEAFGVDKPMPAAVTLAEIVRGCCEHLAKALHLCRDVGSKAEQIQTHLREIRRLENEADVLYRDTERALFAQPPDILLLIKWRELYAWLEATVNACKKASLVISEIVIKGS
jgi:uncharacterized protein Yka (UPF0111/DUF47 family)